jgi:hypothetical protein
MSGSHVLSIILTAILLGVLYWIHLNVTTPVMSDLSKTLQP